MKGQAWLIAGAGLLAAWYYFGRPSSQTLHKSYELGSEDFQQLPHIYALLDCCPPTWAGRTSWYPKTAHGMLSVLADPSDDNGVNNFYRRMGGGYG